MKQRYHTNQASPSAAVRFALLSPVSFIVQVFFFTSDLLTLIETVDLMYHIFYIVYFLLEFLLCSLFLCREALRVLLYWPTLNPRLSHRWLIEQGEKKTKTRGHVVFALSAACSHILLDKIIKQPAYNLINLFYVCEYCNPVGCLLILFTPTLQSTISSQWHIC